MNAIQITLAVATVEEAIAAYRALEAAGIYSSVSVPNLPFGAPMGYTRQICQNTATGATSSEYRALCAEFKARNGRRFTPVRVGATLTPLQQVRVALGMEAGEAGQPEAGLPDGEENIPPDDGGGTF